MNKEECEGMGKEYVEGYRKKDGTYVKGYCKTRSSIRSIFPLKMREDTDMVSSISDIPELPESELSLPSESKMNTSGGQASRNVKLPKSNTMNAKKTYGSLKQEEKVLGKDIRKQDFQDAEFQSARMERDAGFEMQEDEKLAASQMIKAEERYAQQKKRIAKREYGETKRKISSEKNATKHNIKQERKRISHEKKEKRRQEKLEKLKQK